jgi:adenylate kinase family enzyme
MKNSEPSKILIFGNSGSGKSTLAKELSKANGLAHLDLDTLAWQLCTPPQRLPLNESSLKINEFIDASNGWVIEGCYTDLLEAAVSKASEVIFMNLSVDKCVANAKNRPWEPHKYQSKQAQDSNLAMLIEWISAYSDRQDTFSLAAHQGLYQGFVGEKKMYLDNQRNTK